jgi:HK97 gp10 family phage protein
VADGFSFEGIEEINKLAADLGNASLKATAKAYRAVQKSANEVEAGAKAIAPVDTGALKNSISVDYPSALTAEIGPSVRYGNFVEFGTSRMAPRAYMGPALDRAGPGFAAAMEELGGIFE